jgi:cell shape-determining protein MreC
MLTSSWRSESYISQSASLVPAWFSDKGELANRINELQEVNDNLKARVTSLEAIESIYYDLIKEVGTSAKKGEILAKIIRRPPFTIFDTYVIDIGLSAGVEVGDLAYVHDIPVGKVKSVTKNNSTVTLYSSPEEKLLVNFGTSSSQYEAYGVGNAGLRADIPIDTEIVKESKVTLSDREVSILGTVHAIDKDSGNTYQSVYVALPFDISNTGWLNIRKKE